MAKPIVHAASSARRYGGVPEDYLELHDLMDSSKSAFPDNRHRALTHNSWFFFIVERILGHKIDLTCVHCGRKGTIDHPPQPLFNLNDNSETTGRCKHCNGLGRAFAHTRDICEQHVLEDYGNKFIPTASDYLEGMEFQEWMNNAVKGAPTSHRKLARHERSTKRMAITLD